MKEQSKSICLEGKQLRVWVDNNTYKKLKDESKSYGIELQQYAGLYLRGLRITKAQ